MPRPFLIDPTLIDPTKILFDREAIRPHVPQRFEMEQIEAIHHLDREGCAAAGSRQIRDDEWWVRGHIPDRPIFPGILLIEGAAQLSTWLYRVVHGGDGFLGFGGLDGVRFRGTVVPGDLLITLAKQKEIRSRKAIFDCQALVAGRLIFEGTVTGMMI